MKIAVRAFTMFVVFAGLALASVSSANTNTAKAASQPSAAAVDPGPLGMPVPECGPGVPTCPPNCTSSGCPQPGGPSLR